MSKLDEAKELMGLLKFWLGSIIGLFVAVFGWVVSNYETANNILLGLSVVFLIALFTAFIFVNKKIKNQLKTIRDLKK